MLLSSGCREGISAGVFYDLFQRRKVRWEEGGEARMTFLLCIFSNTFSLRYSTCQGAIVWGTCPEPHPNWAEESSKLQLVAVGIPGRLGTKVHLSVCPCLVLSVCFSL